MAKVTRILLGEKPGQKKVEFPEQAQVSLAELGGKVRQGLLAFAVAVGHDVVATLLEEDVTAIVGDKGKPNPVRAAYRHTTERSSVVLGGRRVAVDKPRARSVSGGEVQLPTWEEFSGDELLSELALERMLAGLSTRRYPAGLEPVGDDLGVTGTKRSSVSRRFVARTSKALDELMGKDLSELGVVTIIADGFEVAITPWSERSASMSRAPSTSWGSGKAALRTRLCAATCSPRWSSAVSTSPMASCSSSTAARGSAPRPKEVFSDLGLIQRCGSTSAATCSTICPSPSEPSSAKSSIRRGAKENPDDAFDRRRYDSSNGGVSRGQGRANSKDRSTAWGGASSG